MSLNDWIISISSGAMALTIAIAGYFIQKWIHTVDEAIKEHAGDIKQLSNEIIELKEKHSNAIEHTIKEIKETIIRNKPFSIEKIDELQREVCLIKSILQEKILPQVSHYSENIGKVILIEKSIEDQNTKISKLFEIIKIIATKTKN